MDGWAMVWAINKCFKVNLETQIGIQNLISSKWT
jgi:hypothetical protein